MTLFCSLLVRRGNQAFDIYSVKALKLLAVLSTCFLKWSPIAVVNWDSNSLTLESPFNTLTITLRASTLFVSGLYYSYKFLISKAQFLFFSHISGWFCFYGISNFAVYLMPNFVHRFVCVGIICKRIVCC